MRNFQLMEEDNRTPDKDPDEDSVLLFYKGISGSCLTLQGATKEGGEVEGGRREREEKCRERQRRWSEEIKRRRDHLKRLHPLHQHSGKLTFILIFFTPSAGFQTPESVRVNLLVKAFFGAVTSAHAFLQPWRDFHPMRSYLLCEEPELKAINKYVTALITARSAYNTFIDMRCRQAWILP